MTQVGVNLLWLAPGRVGGSEESTLGSLRALSALNPPDLHLTVFATQALVDAHPDLLERFQVEVPPASLAARPLRILAESTWLAAGTRRLDLVHHAGGTVPPRRRAPCVLTVHDLQPLERRATHGRVKRAYLGVALPRSIAAARIVVVPSEFVRGTVLDRFGTRPDKVVVVPHGVAAPDPPPAALVEEVRARHGLDGPIVLYPSITYPHKNHRVLVEAFVEVVRRQPRALLVLTGGAGSEEGALAEQVRAAGLSDQVRRLGRVPVVELDALYQLADVVAVPSRYEGFGLPAAEAMARGVAVVASAVTALPEIIGAAGVLVEPDDVAGWSDALVQLLADPAERARLASEGRKRAGAFTWSTNAQGLASVYRGALVAPPS